MTSKNDALVRPISLAREWMFASEELLTPSIDEYKGDDLAKDLLLRLRTVAVPEFHAILTLLAHPIEAMATDVLIRSLLEALAHAAWIVEGEARSSTSPKNACLGTDSEGVSMERRTHCLEYGMAKQFAKNVREGSPTAMTPSTPADAEAWLAEAEEEHRQAGCPGRGRGYGDVARTLADFGQRMRLGAWPVDLWRVTSGVAHHLMPHQFARDVEGTTIWGGPLPDSERLARLDRATKVCANFYQYIVLVMSPGDLTEYQSRTTALMQLIAQAYAHPADHGDPN